MDAQPAMQLGPLELAGPEPQLRVAPTPLDLTKPLLERKATIAAEVEGKAPQEGWPPPLAVAVGVERTEQPPQAALRPDAPAELVGPVQPQEPVYVVGQC